MQRYSAGNLSQRLDQRSTRQKGWPTARAREGADQQHHFQEDEDIEMVANTAGVTESDAKQALEDANGDIADAILKLQG